MFIFIYGFGLIYLLICTFDYNLNPLQGFLISAFAYFLTKTLFKTAKSIFISTSTAVIILVIGSAVIFLRGHLGETVQLVIDFFSPYYLSINQENTVGIDEVRQTILNLFLGLLIYKFINKFIDYKYTYAVLIISSIGICSIGFLNGALSSIKDRWGFCLFVVCNVFFYFYNYYIKNRNKYFKQHKFTPYIALSSVIIIIVLGISQFLFVKIPRPLVFEKHGVGVGIVSQPTEKKADTGINYEMLYDGKIDNQFSSKNIELFRVDTDNVVYLKGIVYEVYQDGEWTNANEGLSLNIPINRKDDYGLIEEIKVDYTHLRTDKLFLGADGIQNLSISNNLKYVYDSVRGTSEIANKEDLAPFAGYEYQFKAYHIFHRDQGLIDLLKTNSDEVKDFDIANTAYAMPDGFTDIKELALEITQGIDTDYDKVKAVISYLNENYRYNLEPNMPSEMTEDPIKYFLFTNHEGFCQQFASAATLLIRSQDIPTRYVIGYHVDTEVSLDEVMNNMGVMPMELQDFAVLDSDAHAWVEVYFSTYGWIMFEATPGFEEVVEPISPGEFKTMEQAVDEEAIENTKSYAFVGIGIVILVIGIVAWQVVGVLGRRKRFRLSRTSEKMLVMYTLILNYLGLMDQKKYDYETYREYAVRVDGSSEFYSKFRMVELIGVYERVVYGEGEMTLRELEMFYTYLEGLKGDAKRYMGVLSRGWIVVKEYLVYGVTHNAN